VIGGISAIAGHENDSAFGCNANRYAKWRPLIVWELII
jgi:hypothetical protein